MKLVCYSVSFRDAPLESRERLAFSEVQQRELLSRLRRHRGIFEGLVLCTCNRTELYFAYPESGDGLAIAEELIAGAGAEAGEVWRRYAVCYDGARAVEHLFSVGAGLDSQMLGEHQIINQLKAAYSAANEEKTTGYLFHRMLHRAFRASKAVRTETNLQAGDISIGAAALELARKRVSLPGAKALLLGAGENAELAGKLLVKAGIGTLWIASRRKESAEALAAGLKFGTAVEIDRIGEYLKCADLAVCTTASPQPLIRAADAGYLLTQRTGPIVIVDIAVPRDVEEAVGELEGVCLFNLDDLNRQADARRTVRDEQVRRAEEIVREQARRFMKWLDSLETSAVAAELMERYLEVAAKEAHRYGRYFAKKDRERLERFAHSLVKKLLHGPIAYLKESGEDGTDSHRLGAAEILRRTMLCEREEKE